MDVDYQSELRDDATTPEKILASILDDLIGPDAWESEYKIDKEGGTEYKVDAYVHEGPIVFEADGERWHPHTEDEPQDLSPKREKWLMEDNRRDEELVWDKGFPVVRIWGKHLKNHREKVRERIKEVLFEKNFPNNLHLFDWDEFEDDSTETIVTTAEELKAGERVRIGIEEDYYGTFEGTVVDGTADAEVDVTGERGSGPLPSRDRFLIETVRLMTPGYRVMAYGVTTHGYTESMGEVESLDRVEGAD